MKRDLLPSLVTSTCIVAHLLPVISFLTLKNLVVGYSVPVLVSCPCDQLLLSRDFLLDQEAHEFFHFFDLLQIDIAN